MSLFTRLFADRRPASPAAAEARRDLRKRRFALESLERREVLSTAVANIVPPNFIGPVSAQVSGLRGQDAMPAAATSAAVASQTGVAFGLNWQYLYNSATKQGTLIIQNYANGTLPTQPVFLGRAGGQVSFFQRLGSTTPTVNGPGITPDARIKVVVYSNAMGTQRGLDVKVGPENRNAWASWEVRARTQTGNLSTSQGSMGWTYEYNGVTHSGVWTITNIPRGNRARTVDLNKMLLNLSPGDPGFAENANRVQYIEMVERGTNNSGGSPTLFVSERTTDPTLSIVLKQRAGDFTIQNNTGYAMTIQSR